MDYRIGIDVGGTNIDAVLVKDNGTIVIALFTIIRTDRNMLLACYSHKHISYRIRTIIRKAILLVK
ncbi:hydantoinase/oxoprolinase N-terminal domain-containing protein [Wolbachia endosymbiont (group A) of Ischnus inquisitorius]|uniref:hydantoinase/oxoprolinase N-terminal domain-containing protein n=1 Tax=Wolbachia endosymbiont (group A) of Ischnus inquisitorius TaxID=3077922 RepID=UPI0031334315